MGKFTVKNAESQRLGIIRDSQPQRNFLSSGSFRIPVIIYKLSEFIFRLVLVPDNTLICLTLFINVRNLFFFCSMFGDALFKK